MVGLKSLLKMKITLSPIGSDFLDTNTTNCLP